MQLLSVLQVINNVIETVKKEEGSQTLCKHFNCNWTGTEPDFFIKLQGVAIRR